MRRSTHAWLIGILIFLQPVIITLPVPDQWVHTLQGIDAGIIALLGFINHGYTPSGYKIAPEINAENERVWK